MSLSSLPYRTSVICFILSVLLAGCGGEAGSREQATVSSPFRVAAVLPASDDFWTQAGIEALKAVEAELGTEVNYVTDVAAEDSEALFEQYAEQEFDFIIGHGGQFIEGVEAAAKNFPRANFAIMGGSYPGNGMNVGGLEFKSDEAGYIAGVLAATKTTANKVAFIGGVTQPELVEMAELFEKGARATSPNIEVAVEWVGSWNDPAKAGALAKTLISDGYDVFAANAGSGTSQVLEAAHAAGVQAISTFSDQSERLPGTVLTTVLFDMPTVYIQAATLVQEGHWEAKLHRLGFRESAIRLATPGDVLTPAEDKQLEQTRVDLIAGKIDLSY